MHPLATKIAAHCVLSRLPALTRPYPWCCVQIPTTDAVKHDDLREASGTFVTELTSGKEFMADHKVEQMEALEANIARTHEELASIMTSLNKGACGQGCCAHGCVGREVCSAVFRAYVQSTGRLGLVRIALSRT